MFSHSIDSLCRGGTAAAAVLWLSLCPLADPDYLTGDLLIGGSPAGAEEEGRRGKGRKVVEETGGGERCQAQCRSAF